MANKNISGDVNVEFTEAQSRQSLESGESVKTLFGKLRKWLTDLGTAAFTNSTDYAAASHNQPSSTINAMTGYSKPQATSAIAATDTLNEAIGKLEKGLEDAGGGLQPGNVDVSTNSVTLTSSSPTATVTLSNATGAVSIMSIGETFSATLSNNTITISRNSGFGEYGYILVSVDSNSTYAYAAVIINVHSEGIILCTWADGSDEAVASMIQAAHNGEINLTDYWSIGDQRIVNNLDTSVISTSTIKLTLNEGIVYDSSDTSKVSNFRIAVEGTSFYTVRDLFSTKLSFNKAQQIKNCLPQAITNNLLTQKISVVSNSGGTTTQSTDVSYAGAYIHANPYRMYGTNETSYSSSTIKYRYWYYNTPNWVSANITYTDTSKQIIATYLMCI